MKHLIALILIVSVSPAFSSVGTVLFTMKQVTAKNGGVARALTRGASLQVNDVILTGADAAAKIKYGNGTLVTIGPDSSYKILAYSPTQTVVIKAELNKGRIESQTNGGSKKEALKTPIVALAITGTSFKVYVPPKTESIPEQTYVLLIEGQIRVGNTTLNPGDSVVATADGVSFALFPTAGKINVNVASGVPYIVLDGEEDVEPAVAPGDVAQRSGTEMASYFSSTVAPTTIATIASSVGPEQQATFSLECFPNGVPLS